MKRKNKPNTQQAMKHLAAQYRADFFRKMKLIMDSVCGKDIFPLIPQSILDIVYLSRCSPFKFRANENCIVSSKHLKGAKVILSALIKDQIIKLPPHNLEITLSDYFTVYMTIKVMCIRMSDSWFSNADKVKESLWPLSEDKDTFDIAGKSMYMILTSYILGESDLSKMLYWYKHEIKTPKSFPNEIENLITISSVIPESIIVDVDGNIRPAIRVGWTFPDYGARWLSINPVDLRIKGSFSHTPLNIYIQSHALNRLSERIDCFDTGIIQLNMYLSLDKPVITHDHNHNLLIEYQIFGMKAGYFRADIVNGIVLLRTFLFITNTGTPEGQLLEKNTGLQMLDKKYLAIDKLSTFMTSDLDKNKEVRHILIACGCNCILELHGNMKPLVNKQSKAPGFDLMLKYLSGTMMMEDKY